jgi:hypothetical protein
MTRDETTTEEKSSRSYWGFVLWPLVILLLYPVSAGPMWLALEKGVIGPQVWRVYEPIQRWVTGTHFEKAYFRYLRLWAPGTHPEWW